MQILQNSLALKGQVKIKNKFTNHDAKESLGRDRGKQEDLC